MNTNVLLCKKQLKWINLNFKSSFERSREKLFGEWYLLTKIVVHVENCLEIVFAEKQIYCAWIVENNVKQRIFYCSSRNELFLSPEKTIGNQKKKDFFFVIAL